MSNPEVATTPPVAPPPRRPLRLWPGVALAAVLLTVRYLVPYVVAESMLFSLFAGLGLAVAILLWWLFFSRAAWAERGLALVAVVAVLWAVRPLLHVSIATGAMGMLFPILAVPTLALAFVGWAAATRHLSDGRRRATMVATIVLASAAWALVRTGGFTGDFDNDFAWRWSPTAEERLLASSGDELGPGAALPPPASAGPAPATPSRVAAPTPVTTAAPPAAAPTSGSSGVPGGVAPPSAVVSTPPTIPLVVRPLAAWPGFRGRERDGVVRGVLIDTDWVASPPVALWRRPVGPGWSSFAVAGDVFYTQEQRGENETVAAYSVQTGEPVWRHGDAARFYEANGGAGPRGTPTLSDGRVYTLGATGIVNALDAGNGAVVWSRNAAADTGAKVPTWGFSGSPLAVDDLVVVAASGALVAYDAATGRPRWFGPKGAAGYTSPHQATIGGVPQILLLSGSGIVGVSPADGKTLWEHEWKGYPIVQPAQTPEGDVLIAVNESSGTRRLAVTSSPGGWTVTERWTSNGLKPYFNDFVVHKGHAIGFDGRILSCIDLSDGRRTWKGGRYGGGQLVLLPEQDVLLVLSEEGELALVSAATDQFKELARFPALDGKTWNHPVLVRDVLLVRNSEEMAAFRLTLARR